MSYQQPPDDPYRPQHRQPSFTPGPQGPPSYAPQGQEPYYGQGAVPAAVVTRRLAVSRLNVLAARRLRRYRLPARPGATLERIYEKRPQADRLLIAELYGEGASPGAVA